MNNGITIDHVTADLLADFITLDGLKCRGPLPITLEEARMGHFPFTIKRMIQRKPVPCANALQDQEPFSPRPMRTYRLFTRNPVTYEEMPE